VSQFVSKLLSAKEAVAGAKMSAAGEVATGIDRWVQQQNSPVEANPNPVIEQTDTGLSKHRDGTYSFVDAQGRYNSDLGEAEAESFRAYVDEDQRAIAEGAPTSWLGNRRNAFGQTSVDLGVQGASAFAGFQILEEVTKGNNYGRIRDRPQTADIEKFMAMQTDPEFAVENEEFRKSGIYQNLEKDYEEVQKNNAQLDAIDAFGKSVKEKIPVNRKDQVAVQAAFKVIAENDGILSAAWNAATNDFGTFAEQGIDSIPYMIAFTAGGPITQAAVLTSLAVGKGNQAIAEFKKVEGRDPTLEEADRIRIWSAAATVAEKFGDMAAVKAIPIARLDWATKVAAKATAGLPGKFANSLTGKALINGVARPAAALAGEGLSGGLTSVSEQMAAKGEVDDWDQVAYDALAEAMGTPGGIAGMVAGRAALKTARAAFKAPAAFTAGTRADTLREQLADPTISDEDRATAQAAYDELPARVKPELAPEEPAPVDPVEEAEIDTSAITDEDLDAQLDAIVLDPANPGDASSKIKALKSRALEPAQEARRKAKLDELITEFNKTAGDDSVESVAKDKPLGILDTEVPDEVLTTELDNATESADVEHIKGLQETKRLQEQLKASDATVGKSMSDVDQEVINGSSDRWTGMNTYFNEINSVTAQVASGARKATQGAQSIKTTLGKMKVHVANMQAKSEAVSSALIKSSADGKPVYLRGKRKTPGKNAPRDMTYTPVTMTEAEFTEARNNKEYVLKIDSTSSNLANAISTEAEYGAQMLSLAENHKNTSYAKAVGTSAKGKAKASQEFADASTEGDNVLVDEIGDTELNILDNLEPGNNESVQPSEDVTPAAEPDSDTTLGEEDLDARSGPPEGTTAQPAVNETEDSGVQDTPEASQPAETPTETAVEEEVAVAEQVEVPEPAPTKKSAEYGTENKLVTQSRADKAREILRKAALGGQFNSGVDPKALAAGVELAVYHIEAGSHKFVDFIEVMVDDMKSAEIRPYLQYWYEEARKRANFDKFTKLMTESWPLAVTSEEDFANLEDDVVREDKYLVAGTEGYANAEQRKAIDEIGAWLDDANPSSTNFVLEGRGGTGKTTILKKIIENAKNITSAQVEYTAATNKAAAILAQALETNDTATIWSALGLRPPESPNVADENVISENKEVVLAGKKLLVIDEASMLGEEILNIISKSAADAGVKVLFLGDSAQLPPIRSTTFDKNAVKGVEFGGQANSPVFNDAENSPYSNRIRLLKPQRQVGTSPILELGRRYTAVLDSPSDLRRKIAMAAREIRKGTNAWKNIPAAIQRAGLIPSDIRSNVFDAVRNAGVIFANNGDAMIEGFLKDYAANRYGTRLVVANNEKKKFFRDRDGKITGVNTAMESVYNLNRVLFEEMYGDKREYGVPAVGDILMSYTSVDVTPEQSIGNASEYQIVEIMPFDEKSPPTLNFQGVTIPYRTVKLMDLISKEIIETEIPVITDDLKFKNQNGNTTYRDQFGNEQEVTLTEAVASAFAKAKDEKSASAYTAFKDANTLASKLGNMDFHPAMAITAWKSQGSTYRNVYVAEESLNSMLAWSGDAAAKNHYQAMYVALSRPTDKLVIHHDKLNAKVNDEIFENIDYAAQDINVKPPKAVNEAESARDQRKVTLARNAVLRKQKALLKELTTDPMDTDAAWQSQEVEVYNDDGTTVTVNAKEQWDALSTELKMVEDLIDCVG